MITLPDEVVRRWEPLAVARGQSLDALVLDALRASPYAAVGEAEPVRRRHLGFVAAAASGDHRPTDVARLRRETVEARRRRDDGRERTRAGRAEPACKSDAAGGPLWAASPPSGPRRDAPVPVAV